VSILHGKTKRTLFRHPPCQLHCENSPDTIIDVSEDEEAAIVERLMESLDERGNNVTEEDPTLSAKRSGVAETRS
jgi:hypothetical protein